MGLSGYFNENRYSKHLETRKYVLNKPSKEGDAQSLTSTPQASSCLLERLSVLKEILNQDGFIFLKLDRALDDDELIAFCGALGTPLPEKPEEISNFVRRGIILEVKEAFSYAPDVSMQPFSKNAILVHTENSRSPLSEQPRYIAFQCIECVGDDCPTYLFPMKDIADTLDKEDQKILHQTYYDQSQDDAAPILRMINGIPIFSFRDFGSDSLNWRYAGEEKISTARVNQAIENLLTAIYQARRSQVKWEPQSLFIFDNFRFFHAKPENIGNPHELVRHLDRVRIAKIEQDVTP